tara:strand:- start:1204 stop:1773 length:570 start_codon:yes stop_codon:yes gene_type:complete
MKLLREYIKEVISETYFPLEGGDKMRVHHSRKGTRSGDEPQVSGFSQKIGNKPDGLWYECQDGSAETWEEFCNTGFGDDQYYEKKYDGQYNVILNDYEILFIPDEYHFEKFYKMYSVPHPADPDGKKGYDKQIDWPRVASDYAGIEICPYLSSKRNDDDSFWYYGWDVASGCVWDPSGVKELVGAGDCE